MRGLLEHSWAIARLDKPALANPMDEVPGQASVLDVAAPFAPLVVGACVKRRA